MHRDILQKVIRAVAIANTPSPFVYFKIKCVYKCRLVMEVSWQCSTERMCVSVSVGVRGVVVGVIPEV